VRLKLICRQVIYELCGVELDFDKLGKLVPKDSGACAIGGEPRGEASCRPLTASLHSRSMHWRRDDSAGFSASDIKATVAAIAFVVTNATRYGVDHEVLNAELQQLGLPKENSDGISRPYRIHRDKLVAQAGCEALRLPRLYTAAIRRDVVYASSACGSLVAGAAATAAGAGAAAAGWTGGSAGSAADAPTVFHFTLGLSHPLSGSRPRVAAASADSSQLLLLDSAWHGSDASRSGAAAAAPGSGPFGAEGRAALLALGVRPLGAAAAAAVGSPAAGSGSDAPQSSCAELRPAHTVRFAASGEKAAALLAELRVARRVLAAVQAASAGTGGAAPEAGKGAGAGAHVARVAAAGGSGGREAGFDD